MNKISRKKFYRIEFQLASPLMIGSGDNEVTDKDIIKDLKGNPYIPASAIAGIVREKLMKTDAETARTYLGDIKTNDGNGNTVVTDGAILFYDATIEEDNDNHTHIVSIRDSVKLDDYKTAIKGHKFDMEVLEPGVVFLTYVEQNYDEGHQVDFGEQIVQLFKHGNLRFGAKTMRGYGEINTINVRKKEFDLNIIDSINALCNFDIYNYDGWEECEFQKSDNSDNKEHILCLKLEQKGGISIRRYTTKVSKGEEIQPDMEQLTIKHGNDEIPVIPGTTWAGAIRHRMKEFGIDIDGKNSIFGYAIGDKEDNKMKSKISFSESQITKGKFKTISRNSIDRFTGGAVIGALFTEKVYYGGETELKIGWQSDAPMPEPEKKALAAALADLHYGFLAIGGETSIGRGLFTIKCINGKDFPADKAENDETIYSTILSTVEEVFK